MSKVCCDIQHLRPQTLFVYGTKREDGKPNFDFLLDKPLRR